MDSALRTAVSSAIVSFFVALVVVFVLRYDPVNPTPEVRRADLDEVNSRLSAIEKAEDSIFEELMTLKRSLDSVESQLQVASERRSAAAVRDAEAAIVLASADAEEISGTSEAVVAEETKTPQEQREEQVEEALAVLFDPSVPYGRKQEIWNDLRKSKLLDDAVSAFKQRADENPDDADAQADLGSAYIQKIFSVSDIEKGIWSMRADKQYDKALTLDDHHWNARFSKAVNYSFNPPIMGLQPKAIEHFEILRSQQEAQDPQPQFAQTYLYLGNLYTNNSKPTKAREIWAKGAALFPDNGELKAKASASEPAE